ncbi:membrane protein [Alsobacter metallidurans]|uniref:Membrane protein n=1 Tax=Alsobacter metallidurans TaxID=340221 RepID=A0A917I6V6_9HYPH|nr:DUF2938 domain-containing protein [Alsobacter metallidurans]GGH15721.1 membrane protein [Alsobacter metallidurans]
MFSFLVRALVIGVGATALMDLWALFLFRSFGIPLANWGLVGRWFSHLPSGRVFHDDIAAAEPHPSEVAIGWIAHYAIGVIYAGALLAIVPGWAQAPTFAPALVLGLVTVGAGWFLLQPGMGAGWAASKRSNAMQIRGLNIAGHVVFALGLYGSALALRAVA